MGNNGLIHVTGDDIYGNSTAAGTSKPQINFNGRQSNGFEQDTSFRDSGINGSIKQTSAKFKEPLMLNQPSTDEFAEAEPMPGYQGSGNKNIRNRESGTLGTSSNNFQDPNDDEYELNRNEFGRDINEEDASIPM